MEDREAPDLAELVNGAVAPVGKLSAAELARKAGVAENTLAKIRRGESVSTRTAEKVRAALGIAPVVELLGNAPEDVQAVQRVVGLWLMGMPDEERTGAITSLIRFMGTPPNGDPLSERLTWLRGR